MISYLVASCQRIPIGTRCVTVRIQAIPSTPPAPTIYSTYRIRLVRVHAPDWHEPCTLFRIPLLRAIPAFSHGTAAVSWDGLEPATCTTICIPRSKRRRTLSMPPLQCWRGTSTRARRAQRVVVNDRGDAPCHDRGCGLHCCRGHSDSRLWHMQKLSADRSRKSICLYGARPGSVVAHSLRAIAYPPPECDLTSHHNCRGSLA